MACIDYGTVIFKNGKRYKADELFPVIDGLDIIFYKCCVEDLNENVHRWFGFDNKKSYRFCHNNNNYWVKEICDRVYSCSVYDGQDRYFIIFGYGIANGKECWDDIKNIYLGKKNAKKVDRILNRFEDWREL